MVPKELPEEKREVTSIKVKPTLWKEVKIEAIKNDIDLSELVERALEAYIHGEAVKNVKRQHET